MKDLGAFIARRNDEGLAISDMCSIVRKSTLPMILDPFKSDSVAAQVNVIEIEAVPSHEQVFDLL